MYEFPYKNYTQKVKSFYWQIWYFKKIEASTGAVLVLQNLDLGERRVLLRDNRTSIFCLSEDALRHDRGNVS